MSNLPGRLLSIDVFRAVTMLLMIFVNDVSSVHNIPAWIEHVRATEDGLGFADTIFPAFLFIVGLSLPFAIKSRINKGGLNAAAVYIIARSVALIVMGFFHVNLEDYSTTAILPLAVWEVLITVGFFLIWLDYPETMPKSKKYIFVGAGIVLLFIMAYVFKGGSPEKPEGLHSSWWGILGIIGWAYLVCAIIFLLSRGKIYILISVLALFFAVNIAVHIDVLQFRIPVIGDASSVSLVMAGTVVSVLYARFAKQIKGKTWWIFLIAAGVFMLLSGLVIRPYAEGISKIRSTPAWIFICTGISILVFEITIFLVDVKGKQNWFALIKPAGTSTLTCYLIPYLLYSIYSLIHFHYPAILNNGVGGLIRSFAVAFIVILIAGIMEKRRIRLKI